MNSGITRENMMFSLPPALRGDESTGALAEATAEVLAERLAEIDRLRIIPNVDALEEGVLDILARDFKVDWWDPNFNLTEKRRTLKSSWRVHKTLGTKAAVDEAISAIYVNSSAKPWFEYGGEPYHFRFEINTSEAVTDLEKQTRVLELARYYQSLRDHLDELRYTAEAKAPAVVRMGGAAAVVVCFPVPEDDGFDFRSAVLVGGGMGIAATVPVPAGTDFPDICAAARMGGQYAIFTTIPVAEAKEE